MSFFGITSKTWGLKILGILVLSTVVAGCGGGNFGPGSYRPGARAAATASSWQVKSIDAQVVSKHWGTVPDSTITAIVQNAKSLGATHLAIAVPYDNQAEWQKWVSIIHSNGLKIFSRSHWNSWEGDNGVAAGLTPTDYNTKTTAFLKANASFLQNGDIFVYCVEPENGKYWIPQYGSNWSGNTTAMAAYNQFIRDGITQGDSIVGSMGVNTHLVSTNGSMAMILDQATIDLMGVLTLDHYVENDSQGTHTNDLTYMHNKMSSDLDSFYSKWGKPIMIGEWGFTINSQEVTDDWQKTVVNDMYSIFASKPYIYGVSYWNFMGNTARLLNDSSGTPTTLRPAADAVKSYFAGTSGGTVTPPPSGGGDTTPGTVGNMLADFESGSCGFDGGTVVSYGASPNHALKFSVPVNGSIGAKKFIGGITLGQYTNLEFDIDTQGATLQSGNATEVVFDQGGYKETFLLDKGYVKSGQTGVQHVVIPLSSIAGLNLNSDAAYLIFRFWNKTATTHYVDNVAFTR